jgi:hypothetical protein
MDLQFGDIEVFISPLMVFGCACLWATVRIVQALVRE